MRIRFWGTRGSLPKPGEQTLRYGGNTSCVEARTDSGTLIVLDCGTGAHALGRALLEEVDGPRRGHLFITHTHWDHIQGLPFFDPLFEDDWQWHVYGPRGLSTSLREVLAGQMQYPYFPIGLDQVAAQVEYHDLVEGSFEIGEVHVTARYMNHPALTLGYRLQADGATVVYATDHEPPRDRARESQGHERFIADADLLVHDAQYTEEEYVDRVGWGHSPVEFVVDSAAAAGVRKVALFHHDPLRNDELLDGIVSAARERAAGSGLEVFAAEEGTSIELAGERPVAPHLASAVEPALGRELAASPTRPVLIAVDDPVWAPLLAEAVEAEGLTVARIEGAEELLRSASIKEPSLVILERKFGGRDALEVCRDLQLARDGALSLPVLVVADREGDVDPVAAAAAGVSDWLVKPFKTTYARTRVRCLLLRQACRWKPAPLPPDEDERLEALQGLGLLDSEVDERFDRYTRIAAALFDAPIALVSLVDEDRQWFKSAQGLEARETDREMAFCSHAILRPDVLVVPDALHDDRFADNPLVTGPPYIRFYAGVPLRSPDGFRLGTLCVIDVRPRELDAAQQGLLADLGRLVESEVERIALEREAEAAERPRG